MVAVRHAITLPLAIASFVAVFYSVGKLMLFLSTPSTIQIQYVWMLNLIDDWTRLEGSLQPITIDAALVILFILQHSLFKLEAIKSVWAKIGLKTAERSIYNLITSLTLVVSASNVGCCGCEH